MLFCHCFCFFIFVCLLLLFSIVVVNIYCKAPRMYFIQKFKKRFQHNHASLVKRSFIFLTLFLGSYGIKPKLPAVGGNEGFGRIIKTGKNVQSLKEGDFVIFAQSGLGKCYFLNSYLIFPFTLSTYSFLCSFKYIPEINTLF